MEQEWYTSREAAIYLDCDVKLIKKWAVKGWYKTYKIFNLIRFKKRELDYFIKHHREKMS
jgi:hypothetical protein